MSPNTARTQVPEEKIEIVDVWSRTSRHHRMVAILMLLLLALLFAGLCCFAFWLRTGVYYPWRYHDYAELMRRSFDPFGAEQIRLSDFLSSPIPVRQVPVYAVIVGLQFASLSSIPVLVAILYRLPISVIFAAMVVFLAAMPWIGITVMIGCILTTLGFFRFSFRYASALIGLIPVTIYFAIASIVPLGASSSMADNQAMLYAPWVLALLGSCVICAVALAIARLINSRPGGIPPVLATLFAIPVILFYTQVGRDELEYRLLEQEFGPGGSSIFASVDIADLAGRRTMRRWSETKNALYDSIYKETLQQTEQEVLLRAEHDRFRTIADSDDFLDEFPKSRYVASVLFLKGRAQDCRIDRYRLRENHRAEFRSDLPSRASKPTWQRLIQQFPMSDLSATGLLNASIQEAREGNLDAAIASLDLLTQRFDASSAVTQPAQSGETGVGSVFERPPPSSGLAVDMEALVSHARRLREMLAACRDDRIKPYSSLFGPRGDGSDRDVSPVQVLMWLDDADPYYKTNLEGLILAFPGSKTSGYAAVRLALREPAISRLIQRLENAAESLSGLPAGAEARFYLGEALQEDSLLEDAKIAFQKLIADYPESCWSQEAKQRLTALPILQEAAE